MFDFRLVRVAAMTPVLFLAGCKVASVDQTGPNLNRVEKVQNVKVDELHTVVIDKSNITKTIKADGRAVVIRGNGGKLKITGGCNHLTVSGSGNRVHCDFADVIAVSGNKNTLVFDSVSTGTVTGDGNSLSWKRPTNSLAPVIDFTGINNLLEHTGE